jgi:transcriptional antiterminator RfaH
MVCIGEKPAALPDGAVEDLMAAEDERGYFRFNHSMEFKKGQTVKINSGPLSDVIAIFEDMADSERVAVLLELLGRKVRVKLPFEAISSFA